MGATSGLRRAVALVAALNLAYFAIEFCVALQISSVSLFADSADFFEDAAVNFLILVALGWSARSRANVGIVLAAILLVPAIAFLWALWGKIAAPTVPDPIPLSLIGLGALAVNLLCAFSLARWRHGAGSLTKAAFLSARNDAVANVGVIGAGLVTYSIWPSIWPDVIVGVVIAAMNIGAAREVLEAAREEHAAAP